MFTGDIKRGNCHMYKLQKNRLLILGLILLITYTAGCGGSKSPDNPINSDLPAQLPTIIEDGEVINLDNVSIDGIVFYFDKQYPTGKFANGDFWVKGPVTITQITPNFDGRNNGWEVNPVVDGGHGFQDGGKGGGFDPSLVPSLPYRAEGRISIVKTTSSGQSRPCIKKAVVLTVIDDIPPANGATVFRPPYVGDDKQYYYVTDLKTDLLPSYAPVANMPTLESIKDRFSKLRMYHKQGAVGRSLRPEDNMDDYQPANTPHQNNAVLRFMINDSIEDKMPALINYVQFGIDHLHTIYLGNSWPDGDGHEPGHRIAPAFAAVMLGIEDGKRLLREIDTFHGTRYFFVGENTNGLILWGGNNTEAAYWRYITSGSGNRSNKDPYGYIDGGRASEPSYQHIVSQSYKGEILATLLMPVLKEAWNMNEWLMNLNYVDRWVYHGRWTRPDPFAPYDGDPNNYGITYGPHKETGVPIPGSGRYLDFHGAFKDEGQYRSDFVASMWNAYRHTAEGAESAKPYVTIIHPYQGHTVNGTFNLQATAFGIHGIASVQFRVNGTNIGSPVTASVNNTTTYQVAWDTKRLTNGRYSLTVEAVDHRGNRFTSSIVEVEVGN